MIWHLHLCRSVQKTDDGQRVKYTRFAWAGGTFFPVVLLCCVSFWFWREMRELSLHYFLTDCFGIEWEIVFGVTYILSVQYSCVVVSVFCCGWKVNFVWIPYSHDRFSKISRTFFVKKRFPYKTYVQEDQLFLALYGSTTIQSLLFLKNIKHFVWFPKQYLLGFFILQTGSHPSWSSFLLVVTFRNSTSV